MTITSSRSSGTGDRLDADGALRACLAETLGLDSSVVAGFQGGTPLFGALPELDSMGVATILTDLEDRLHILIEDDDIDAETFETYGNFLAFVERKLAR